MNSLETFIDRKNLSEVDTMNRLNDAGIISDNAVLACEVCDEDCRRAVEFLSDWKLDL